MSNTAPVCEIQPVISTAQPAPPKVPSIPPATDLASALNAINALAAAMRYVLSHLPPPNPNPQGSGGGNTQAPALGRWNQVNRSTAQVKVTNPQDPSQYVIIDRINSLTMRDSKTGETWVWSR